MKNDLDKYLRLVIPQPLLRGEKIALLFSHKEEPRTSIRYAETFEEVSEYISKYSYLFNIFIGIDTYIFISDKKAVPNRRQVVFLDFDKKDYPEFDDVSDYSKHLKNAIPKMYNHAIVASGSGGYHFYIAVEPTPSKELSDLNKRIAKLSGADIMAANSAQKARIPTSYNWKILNDKKYVKLVNCTIDEPKFKRYSVSNLQSIISKTEINNKIEIPKQEAPIQTEIGQSKCYCVEKMLNLGCKQGERNFAMGRIIAKLKNDLYAKSKALDIILDWNKRCNPPKDIKAIKDDFNRYWNNNNYLLLGCNLPDGRQKNILSNYCDKSKCMRYQNYEITKDTSDIITIPDIIFDKRNIRRISGIQYFILLLIYTREFCENENIDYVRNYFEKTGIISKRTFNEKLKQLTEFSLIIKERKGYRCKQTNSNYVRTITIKKTVLRAFLLKYIGKKDFYIYLTICTLLQQHKNATYDSISEYTNVEKSSISKYIKNLNKAKVIKIDNVYNERGLPCNRYTFL